MIEITQLKQLIAVLSGLILSLQGYLNHPPVARFSPKPVAVSATGARLFGAVTTSGSFPTSTNVFQDGDVINSGDWNNLETWMGTRNSTDTLSINYRLASSSSIDPGHKHTTGAVSGTIAVAQGGTATSSLTSGAILTGNGTSSVGFLAPTQSGQLAISSGTTWVANTLTAGTNITLTTSTGAITVTASGGGFHKVQTSGSGVSSAGVDVVIATTTLTSTTLIASSSMMESHWQFDDNGTGGACTTASDKIKIQVGTSTIFTLTIPTSTSGNINSYGQTNINMNNSTSSENWFFLGSPAPTTGAMGQAPVMGYGTDSGNVQASTTVNLVYTTGVGCAGDGKTITTHLFAFNVFN